MELAESSVTLLSVPPVPRLVPHAVFDAFGWCETSLLEWRSPASGFDVATHLSDANPPRMVFVLKGEYGSLPLPRELARLHAPGLGLKDEWALAPYGIDDATDELYARRITPGSLFWLAADSLNALFWGLHDWAHFHNHGPFDQIAWTELQCDAAALSWLGHNRQVIGLDETTLERTRVEAIALSRARFAREGIVFDPAELLSPRPAWVSAWRAPASGERARGEARRARSTTDRG